MPRSTTATRYGPWEQLRLLRLRSETAQSALASYVGISKQQMANLENGHRWPSQEVTRRIAKALNVPSEMIDRGTVAPPKSVAPEHKASA
jgi:transcriptional regulator with XRE-family HTH domain